jgi:hypothetical protein
MEGSLSNKLLGAGKAAFYGFLGATAIIHITPLVRPIFRDFEDRFIREKHNEFEIATLLIVGFLTLIMEPVTYLINLATTLERHGFGNNFRKTWFHSIYVACTCCHFSILCPN